MSDPECFQMEFSEKPGLFSDGVLKQPGMFSVEYLSYPDCPEMVHLSNPECYKMESEPQFEAELSIPGYKLFHQGRDHKKGGGVLLYVKNDILACKLRKDKQDKYNSLWVELTESNRQKMNGVIYQPKTLSLADDNLLFHELSTFCNRDVLIIIYFNSNDTN